MVMGDPENVDAQYRTEFSIMALGALKAIESANRTVGKDIYLVGVDALTEALEDIKADTMTGTVFNDFFGQSHTAAEICGKFAKGEKVDSVNMVDYVKVTGSNAQDILDILGE